MYKTIFPTRWGYLGLSVLVLSSPAVLADISGKVFRDFNANGVFDTGATFNEVGMDGVTVKAFDADDAAASPTATATSGADGAYVLTGLAAGTDYRVEFSWAESWLKPGAAGGTSVQFAKDGATGASLPVQNPAQYCQAQPFIAIPEMLNGDPLVAGTSGDKQSLVSFSAGWAGNAGDTAPLYNILGKGKDTGAVHGLAYHPASSSLFMAAVAKRHVGFGSAGAGAIYKASIDTATGQASSAPVLFADLNALGVSAGTIDRSGGALSSNAADPNHDPNAFDAVGKASLGDIEVSDDQKTLWVVNLFDRKLYGMAVDEAPTSIADLTSFDLVSAFTDLGHTCVDGEFRPWALKVHDGKVYVGGVCSAENVKETEQAVFGSAPDMDSQANRDKLHAYILALEPTSGVFTDVYNFPLNYERAQVGVEWNGANKIPAEWRPWIKSWDEIHDPEPGAGSYEQTIYPQPMLTDIEFDDDGKTLILGFLDRAGHQLGNANYSTVAGDTVTYEGVAAGDILRICPGADGKLALETNGSCGAKTTVGANTGEGPGNGEYYFADNYGTPGHAEVALGGLARIYGLGKTVSSAFDPDEDYRSGGVFWLNDTTGAKDSAYVIYDRDDDGSSNGVVEPRTPATFGKAAGLGDMETLCNAAPIEVGNRIWQDLDKDGIQDADEAGIDKIDVVLTCGADTATAQTANGGQFLFSSATNATFMDAGESCKLTVAAAQVPLEGWSVTTQNADSATDNSPLTDVRDSDATAAGEVAFKVGNVGENNHALDIGYKNVPAANADLELTKIVTPVKASPGETVVYTLTITNKGADAATGVEVSDQLPGGVTYVSDDGDAGTNGDYDPDKGIWTVGGLAKDESKILKITVTVE